jgi:DNA-binding transcriptional LysR family regulator
VGKSIDQAAALIYEVISGDSEAFPMRPLPPELLRSFVAVAQTGSFTVASERVCLSQSTVSQHIRRLEDLVGRPLFERDTRNVSLSRHGNVLHEYAVRILDLMNEALSAVCGPSLNGTVRLGLPEDFVSSRLSTALSSFVQRNPDVELIICTGMSGDLFRELDEDRLDLVFAKRLSGSQRGQVVRQEPLYWCVGPNSRLSGGDAVLPLALHPEPSVSRARIFEVLKAAGRPYRVALVSSNIAVLKAAVIAGLGISAFAGHVIGEGLLRLEADLPELGELDYVIDRKPSVSPVTLALEDVLRDAVREL